ncbi:hypothetical protein [Pseudomonas sp. COW5]|uniref:hypothetical protein n=1 Tax=Pseudomonas sp. COW5 TaxID=2981253 RepID=UPI002245ED2C|nr:hypothetical protein [Pseudomonas sp. COW5]MCX2544566.1 hypothetical protein [Pseudomonas sp. COW5]
MKFSFGKNRTFTSNSAFVWGLGAMLSTTAHAVTQEMRASFIPDPGRPQNNAFVDQTPQSGYCGTYVADCKAHNLSGVRLPLRFSSVRSIEPGATVRNGAMFKIPNQWRSLTVKHVATGEAATVEMRIGGVGTQYVLSDTAVNLTGAANDQQAHNELWGGRGWWFPSRPCDSGAMSAHGPNFYRSFWRGPAEAVCSKEAAFRIPWMSYDYLDVGYELRTPNPLAMSAGVYTGELTYGAGPGQDIDAGDNLLPDNSTITFRFVLDVQHILKVDLPPGGSRIELVPQGGWQAWLQEGRRPVRLFRDQTFNLSTSSRFRMSFKCQYGGIGACALRDAESGSTFPQVYLSVSLPHGITDAAGQPVKHKRLTERPTDTLFQPGAYVDRAPGVLHFEVPSHYMEHMLQPGQVKHYAGNVTVIWDSEV